MIIEDQDYKSIDFTVDGFIAGEYERCRFINCNFRELSLQHSVFRECIFEACDISLCNPANTIFNDIRFESCKILGVHFEHCNPMFFSVRFSLCQLSMSVFYKLKMKKTVFDKCRLDEVDFSETDLSAAVFHECDMQGAAFNYSNLEKADFRTALNYRFDPEINKIKNARFTLPGVIGLLSKYPIIIE